MPWHSIKTRKCKPLTLQEVQWLLDVADSCVTKKQKINWIRFMGKQQSRLERGSLARRLIVRKRSELTDSLDSNPTLGLKPALSEAQKIVLATSPKYQYNWR
ncbi:hypothetical protein VPHD249_0155 [Vibrio phage D249]|nr:hypothetical protein SIPHO036v1_70008 [Vibrio phage 70E38.1]QZI88047.1 hypothetical protein SIPHO041v1_p0136 [Vibrio phage 234P1]QZI88221.1 hypothetical protein SIPHO035v1_p0130 [Vibrio phage 234P7B]QZI88313.1 hypothetical protein SIPHO082v1_p0036 [Vibrio phage 294E48.1]QZI88587.1 hypothetical protein SIPHO037v1_p0146 [Vibrio phage 70E35.2]QZI88954.1 hypothetical protein SIPHO040v1_p0141 [Vibrio phage 70E35.6]QZI89066.1 hypothetical protein SIPHO042v1_p0069 [Vibrio phage 70E37.1]QZI89220.